MPPVYRVCSKTDLPDVRDAGSIREHTGDIAQDIHNIQHLKSTKPKSQSAPNEAICSTYSVHCYFNNLAFSCKCIAELLNPRFGDLCLLHADVAEGRVFGQPQNSCFRQASAWGNQERAEALQGEEGIDAAISQPGQTADV